MQAKLSIRIDPYRFHWPEEFRSIAAEIRAAVGDLALRIDHIGSTAVPGLEAKDVIDIQITVAALDSTGPLAGALEAIGYVKREDVVEDHLPPGHDLPPEELCKRYFSGAATARPIHVHVREDGRFNQRYALLFRDYLREHTAASAAYAEIKRQLARLHPDDYDAYYAIKDPVCDLIMVGAYAWAAASAWQPGPSDA